MLRRDIDSNSVRRLGNAENARTENAGLVNVAPYCKGGTGKCRTWKRGTALHGDGKRGTGNRGNDEVWKAKRNLTT